MSLSKCIVVTASLPKYITHEKTLRMSGKEIGVIGLHRGYPIKNFGAKSNERDMINQNSHYYY